MAKDKKPELTEKTKRKYEHFAKEYHLNGNHGTNAAIEAGYSKKSARNQAKRLLKYPHVKKELKRLRAESDKVAEEEFSITLKQRLQWLEQVVTEGLKKYPDFQIGEIEAGPEKPFNLQATVSAVKELNSMLGTPNDKNNQPQTIVNNIMPVPVADSVESWEAAAIAQQKEALSAQSSC